MHLVRCKWCNWVWVNVKVETVNRFTNTNMICSESWRRSWWHHYYSPILTNEHILFLLSPWLPFSPTRLALPSFRFLNIVPWSGSEFYLVSTLQLALQEPILSFPLPQPSSSISPISQHGDSLLVQTISSFLDSGKWNTSGQGLVVKSTTSKWEETVTRSWKLSYADNLCQGSGKETS